MIGSPRREYTIRPNCTPASRFSDSAAESSRSFRAPTPPIPSIVVDRLRLRQLPCRIPSFTPGIAADPAPRRRTRGTVPARRRHRRCTRRCGLAARRAAARTPVLGLMDRSLGSPVERRAEGGIRDLARAAVAHRPIARSVKSRPSAARRVSAARAGAAIRWLRATPVGRTAWRVAETLVEIELVDRALALAAQIFTSVLPVIIAASAFGGRQPTTDTIRDQFGFDPAVLHAGNAATSSDRSLTAFGVVGLLMIILSGTFRAGARPCLRGGVAGAVDGAAGCLAVVDRAARGGVVDRTRRADP